MIFMFLGGILSDNIGRKWVIFAGMIFMVLLAYPYVLAIGSGYYPLALGMQIASQPNSGAGISCTAGLLR